MMGLAQLVIGAMLTAVSALLVRRHEAMLICTKVECCAGQRENRLPVVNN